MKPLVELKITVKNDFLKKIRWDNKLHVDRNKIKLGKLQNSSDIFKNKNN